MPSHEIMTAHPAPLIQDHIVAECIDACYDCAHACMSCADACLAEDEVNALRHCIQSGWNCASICHATVQVLARQTGGNLGLLSSLVQCCRQACEICARECEPHGGNHRHCALCAKTCHLCAETCRELLKAV